MPQVLSPSEQIREVFAALDDKDVAALAAHISDDIRMTLGNEDLVEGKPLFVQAAEAFIGSLASIRHEIRSLWVVDDGSSPSCGCTTGASTASRSRCRSATSSASATGWSLTTGCTWTSPRCTRESRNGERDDRDGSRGRRQPVVTRSQGTHGEPMLYHAYEAGRRLAAPLYGMAAIAEEVRKAAAAAGRFDHDRPVRQRVVADGGGSEGHSRAARFSYRVSGRRRRTGGG